jgi:hypothetical protein
MTTANQQGLFQLIYWTWLHNYQPIALGFGCLLAIGLMIYKPKRIYMIFFLGFLFLLLQFEYLKHFQKHLEEQTLQTAVLEAGQSKARKAINLFFNRLIPFGLYLGGWGLIFLGMLIGGRSSKNK